MCKTTSKNITKATEEGYEQHSCVALVTDYNNYQSIFSCIDPLTHPPGFHCCHSRARCWDDERAVESGVLSLLGHCPESPGYHQKSKQVKFKTYRIAGLFRGRKFSRILRICPSSQKYYSRILHARAAPACACLFRSGGVADIMAIRENFIREIH